MKRLILINIVMTLLVAAAFATPTIKVNTCDPYISGISELTPSNADAIVLLGPNKFQTFCLETTESIRVGDTYLFNITDQAIAGGASQKSNGIGPDGPGALGGDPLDPWTAYLYTGVRKGTLSGYNPATDAFDVQKAIWYIEGEATNLNTPQGKAQGFYDLAAASGWTDTGNVVVLNLYELNPGGSVILRQDFVGIIPAPGAVVLGGIGVAFVGWLRRKRTF